MNSDQIEELQGGVSEELKSKLGLFREHAEHFAVETVEKMADAGEVIELTDDEQRMLAAYRKFCRRNSSGMFSWFKEFDQEIVFPGDESLIVDPRDLSAC